MYNFRLECDLMPEIDLRNCTADPETCGVVLRLFEMDEIAAAAEDIDIAATAEREIFGNFVTACVNGTCPGMDLEFARKQTSQKKPS